MFKRITNMFKRNKPPGHDRYRDARKQAERVEVSPEVTKLFKRIERNPYEASCESKRSLSANFEGCRQWDEVHK